MKCLMGVFFTTVLTVALLSATEFNVDREKSTVGFKVRHMLISTTKGTFDSFLGAYDYNESRQQFSTLEGEVKVASIDTDDSSRDAYLLSEAFFDVQNYPTMELKLITHKGEEMVANLTIKDITKAVSFKVERLEKNQFGLKGEINRKDFNLNFSSMAEVGGIAVSETIKIYLIMVGSELN